MTIEEKLQYFQTASIENSRLQSEEAIKNYTKELEDEFELYKENIDELIKSKLKVERDRIIQAHNHESNAKVIIIKKKLSEAHDTLKDQLFCEVKELLENYRRTDEYKKLLISNFKKALIFANGEKSILYIDPADASLKAELESAINHPITISEYGFGGGCRTVVVDSEILIDNSFDSSLSEQKEQFTFNGGRLND